MQVAIVYGFAVLVVAAVHAGLGKLDLRVLATQVLGTFFFLLPTMFARAARHMVERNWLKGYGPRPLETEYTICDEEVRVTNYARELCIKFSLVRYVAEHASHFVLYAAGPIALEVVPKRAFREDELPHLRALLLERPEPAGLAPHVTWRSLFRPLLWLLASFVALFIAAVVYQLLTHP